jgi:hypothetical protein
MLIKHNTVFSLYLDFEYDTNLWILGANMVKWTKTNSCLVLNEGDSKPYTYYEFCVEENHKHLENTIIYKIGKRHKERKSERVPLLLILFMGCRP